MNPLSSVRLCLDFLLVFLTFFGGKGCSFGFFLLSFLQYYLVCYPFFLTVTEKNKILIFTQLHGRNWVDFINVE